MTPDSATLRRRLAAIGGAQGLDQKAEDLAERARRRCGVRYGLLLRIVWHDDSGPESGWVEKKAPEVIHLRRHLLSDPRALVRTIGHESFHAACYSSGLAENMTLAHMKAEERIAEERGQALADELLRVNS